MPHRNYILQGLKLKSETSATITRTKKIKSETYANITRTY